MRKSRHFTKMQQSAQITIFYQNATKMRKLWPIWPTFLHLWPIWPTFLYLWPIWFTFLHLWRKKCPLFCIFDQFGPLFCIFGEKSAWGKKSAWEPGSQVPAYYAGLPFLLLFWVWVRTSDRIGTWFLLGVNVNTEQAWESQLRTHESWRLEHIAQIVQQSSQHELSCVHILANLLNALT